MKTILSALLLSVLALAGCATNVKPVCTKELVASLTACCPTNSSPMHDPDFPSTFEINERGECVHHVITQEEEEAAYREWSRRHPPVPNLPATPRRAMTCTGHFNSGLVYSTCEGPNGPISCTGHVNSGMVYSTCEGASPTITCTGHINDLNGLVYSTCE